jgi:hypothetical protein
LIKGARVDLAGAYLGVKQNKEKRKELRMML